MIIRVKVKTGAKERRIEKISANFYKIFVKSPPVKGKANKEIIEILSNYFDVPKSKIKIVKGLTSKEKEIEILQD